MKYFYYIRHVFLWTMSYALCGSRNKQAWMIDEMIKMYFQDSNSNNHFASQQYHNLQNGLFMMAKSVILAALVNHITTWEISETF